MNRNILTPVNRDAPLEVLAAGLTLQARGCSLRGWGSLRGQGD
jgi:hypothetical protein